MTHSSDENRQSTPDKVIWRGKVVDDGDDVGKNNHSPMEYPTLPLYDDIPAVQDMPHGCTWGLWDHLRGTSDPDQLGTLNLLTPTVVKAAREEIQTGDSVALNWRMDHCHTPHSNRIASKHKIFTLKSAGGKWTGHDDEVHFNTQGGSQWDGFRHWAYQPTETYYNGVTHGDITNPSAPMRNGIDEWSKRGGIVGRGILLDYHAWAAEHGVIYSPVEYHGITIDDLEAVAAWQGTRFVPGDILLIRSGFVDWYQAASPRERVTGTAEATAWAGVEGSETAVRWFWNRRFSAVGGDASVFEAWPAKEGRWRLHDNLIALFGMPVGEMFDLERLSAMCKEQKKWSFFFTSAPLNFPGGIASPPNAICTM